LKITCHIVTTSNITADFFIHHCESTYSSFPSSNIINRLDWPFQGRMEAAFLQWEVHSDGTPYQRERVFYGCKHQKREQLSHRVCCRKDKQKNWGNKVTRCCACQQQADRCLITCAGVNCEQLVLWYTLSNISGF
jgi:hypothetical protein